MASPSFFIKQNDDTPTLDVALLDDKQRRVDVTGATVVFSMRNTADDSVKIDTNSASILNATRGEVRYSWAAGDTDTAGNFEAEFQVTFSNGDVQTFPNDDYIDVIITEEVA